MKQHLKTLAGALLALSGTSYAAPQPLTNVSDESVPVPPGVTASLEAAKARAEFLKKVEVKGSEDFGEVTDGTATPTVIRSGTSFFVGSMNTATLTQDDPKDETFATLLEHDTKRGGDFNGRFDTTDSYPDGSVTNLGNWLDTYTTFTLTFQQSFSAFGFYVTDLADFDVELSVEFLNANGVAVGNAGGVVSRQGSENASLQFVGFFDSVRDADYRGVRFTITQNGEGLDAIGFDDMFVGLYREPVVNPAPEPGSLALVGTSLFLLGAARRRRRG